MPPDTQQDPIEQPIDETPTDDTPPADPPPVQAAPSAPPAPQKDKGKKVVMHSPGAISAIKAEERAKAERQLMKRLDDQARALGYRSHDDMMQQAARAKQQPPPQRQQPNASPPSQQPPNRDTRRVDQRVAQANEQVRKANKARANTDKRNKELERNLRAMEAETELKILAVRCGVRDVDYAISLIKRHTSSMTPEALEAFDEEKYFREDLRKERPYLYGEEVRPADTTPTSAKPDAKPGEQPPTPPPPNPPPNGQPGEVNVKDMTRAQFEEFLAKKGLSGALSSGRPS